MNISGSIAIRKNGPFPAGQVLPGHEHNFDHTTICFVGALKIVAKDKLTGDRTIVIKSPRPGYDGPSEALIAAGVKHEITGLEEANIFWCVYSHRDDDGAIVMEYAGNERAYSTWINGKPS